MRGTSGIGGTFQNLNQGERPEAAGTGIAPPAYSE